MTDQDRVDQLETVRAARAGVSLAIRRRRAHWQRRRARALEASVADTVALCEQRLEYLDLVARLEAAESSGRQRLARQLAREVCRVTGAMRAGAVSESVAEEQMRDVPATRRTLDSVAAIVAPDVTRGSLCAACGGALEGPKPGGGRRRRFCSGACRERARLRRERGVREDLPRVTARGRARLARILELEEAS